MLYEVITGNCEGRDVLSGAFDVVVCDGFDGNIVLKGTEGAAGLIMDLLKQGLMSSFRTKIGALICKPAFKLLVITSYSIHYTKLYDCGGCAGHQHCIRRYRAPRRGRYVITSYSIHYTKLYDGIL